MASHYNKNTMVSSEGHFLLVFWIHTNLVITRVRVKKAHDFMYGRSIDNTINVRDGESLWHSLFKYLKSLHILNLSSFLCTTTIFTNHVGYLTSWIEPIWSNRATSSLTNSSFLNEIDHCFCFTGETLGSIPSLCTATSGGIL